MKYVDVILIEGFADWEAALALCEIRKSGRYSIRTVSLNDDDTVTSMGGLHVQTNLTFGEYDLADTAMLILPGGDGWEKLTDHSIYPLLKEARSRDIWIAGICGATTALARAGLLDEVRHTSNSHDYLLQRVPDYRGGGLYTNHAAVSEGNIITAGGLSSTRFAFEVIQALDIYDTSTAEKWYLFYQLK